MKTKLLIVLFSVTLSNVFGQNMWQQYHTSSSLVAISFVDKYVWLGIESGAIRVDTTNWSYQWFDNLKYPAMMLGVTGYPINTPKVINAMKMNNGHTFLAQEMNRSIEYDGVHFINHDYPAGVLGQDDEQIYIDSSGTRWNYGLLGDYFQYDDGFSWDWTWGYSGYCGVDDAGCLYTYDSNGDFIRVCSPTDITYPVLPGNLADDSKIMIGHSGNIWGVDDWIMEVNKFDGTNLFTYSYPNFPVGTIVYDALIWTQNKIVFTTDSLLYSYDGNNLVELNTTGANSANHWSVFKASPTGRLFAIGSNCGNNFCDPGSQILYSTIDGLNWNQLSFEDIPISSVGIFCVDSTNTFLGGNANGSIGKFKSNWVFENKPAEIPNTNYTISANGTPWFFKYPNIAYRWNLNGSVDSVTLAATNLGWLIAANDNRCWIGKGMDTIIEFNNTGILYTYIVPNLSYTYFGAGNIAPYNFVKGNDLYFSGFISSSIYHLIKLSAGTITDISNQTGTFIHSDKIFKDHQNNFWLPTFTALYKWNGTVFDSIPLPFFCSGFRSMIFDGQDNPYVILNTGNPSSWLGAHLYKYENTAWTELQKPSPLFDGNLFYKDGYFWVTDAYSSLLRFDPQGIPNVVSTGNVLSGTVFHDWNNNNIQNANESGDDNVLVHSNTGLFSYTAQNGSFVFLPDSGQHTFSCIPPLYYTVTPASIPVNVNPNTPNITGVNFALHPVAGMNDVTLDLTSAVYAFNGTHLYYYVQIHNVGTTAQTASLSFTIPSVMTTNYIYPVASGTSGNVLTWNFGTLAPDSVINLQVFGTIPNSFPIGDSLVAMATVTPQLSDLTLNNNSATDVIIHSAPFDPNIKLVEPTGIGDLGYTDTSTTDFTYTIFFQNTGTAPAVNVRVDDILDTDFDLTTFKIISSSATVSADLTQAGIAKFYFNNINLPDSNSNEPLSHGFVKYSLKRKPGSGLGKQFFNNAAIYFDYQAPVNTNTTLNSLFLYNGTEDLKTVTDEIKVYPNPVSNTVYIQSKSMLIKNISVFDLLGKKLSEKKCYSKSTALNLHSLSIGMYFISVEMEDGTLVTKKIVKN